MAPSNGFLIPETTKPSIRRLSSTTTNLGDLKNVPMVVVPPEHLHAPSDAHETAAAMEMAKHRLSELSMIDGITPPETPPEATVSDSYAFAFDIDGVLIRGGKPIPEAVEAMKMLNGQNEFGVKM